MKFMKATQLGLILIIGFSCEDISIRESISPIVNTELPSTGVVGETISFKIYHVVFNGCGQYSRHETNTEGKVVTVRFYGRYPNGKICPDNIPTLETGYNFRIKESGDYIFKFYNDSFNGNEFVLDTLRVL